MLCRFSKKQLCILGGITLLGVIVLGACLGLLLNKESPQTKARGGVVSNGFECAGIGRDILDKGGSAADAAIAALVCEGVAMPQSTGLGGGFVLTIYTKATGKVETLNAREVAPFAATADMYHANSTLSELGGLAVAVPGELRGYEAVWMKYGKLSWRDLLQPTIDLCRKGHHVTYFLEKMLRDNAKDIKLSPSLSELFLDPATGDTYKKGQLIKRLKLADTLEIIATEGADALYNGSLTKGFVEDIKKFDGIITEEDMRNYTVEWADAIVADLPYDQKLYAYPLPGSGLILNFILGILRDFLDLSSIDTLSNWQRIVESMKYGYGKRTQLGDINFVDGIEQIIKDMANPTLINEYKSQIFDKRTFQDPSHYGANVSMVEDHGTAHICVLATNGDAVSVTGTINLIFGAKIVSPSTGIILNDEMDDFSTQPSNAFGLPSSPANFIQPGKRPLSSMTPSIILNKDGSVRLIVGAAGGSKITTSIAIILIKHLWYGKSLRDSIAEKRLHHQLYPMEISFEHDFNGKLRDGLHTIGHKFKELTDGSGFAAVTGIANSTDGIIEIAVDPRRNGSEIYLP